MTQRSATARSAKEITDNIAHAELDAALFALLQDPAAIDALTESLARHWFGRGLEDLDAVVQRSAEVSRYERRLRTGLPLAGGPCPMDALPDKASFLDLMTAGCSFDGQGADAGGEHAVVVADQDPQGAGVTAWRLEAVFLKSRATGTQP